VVYAPLVSQRWTFAKVPTDFEVDIRSRENRRLAILHQPGEGWMGDLVDQICYNQGFNRVKLDQGPAVLDHPLEGYEVL
jgi:hypothetical protein